MRVLLSFLLCGVAFAQTNVFEYTAGNGLSNFSAFTNPTDAEPTKGNCITDAFWGTSVCKAVDVVTDAQPTTPSATVLAPPYTRWAVDNANGSLYFSVRDAENPSGKGQMMIFSTSDNSLYSIVTSVSGHESAEFRWDHSDPDLMYYRSGCKFYSYVPSTATSTQLHDFGTDFAGCTRALNGVEGDSSLDSRYWAFLIQGTYAYNAYPLIAVTVWDKTTNTIVGTLDRTAYLAQGGSAYLWDSYGYGPNMVDIAPSGDRVLLLWPSIKYPIPYHISLTGSSVVASNVLTVQGPTYMPQYWAEDDVVKIACSGGAAGLTGNYPVLTVTDHALTIDISATGLSDGSYSCSTIDPALSQVVVTSGTAVATTGAPHNLQAGWSTTISGASDACLNKTVALSSVTERTFTFSSTCEDGTYNSTGMLQRAI